MDRARAVRPGFALTEGNAAAVAEICRRLEGLPLAIELAAARTRLLDPPALLDRLAASLDALGTGAVDLPERQHTLRATVEWSVGLLTDAERSLLEVAAVFADGWTIQAAAQVAVLEEDRALELSEALARHSLIYATAPSSGPGRGCWRPSASSWPSGWRPGPTPTRSGAATPASTGRWPSRRTGRCAAAGPSGRSGWSGCEAEAGNLAAAVRWYLAHDPGPLPHLFRVLWLFWLQRDLQGQAQSWVEQFRPAATLDPQARAELAWVAAALIAVTPGTTRRRWRPASAWHRCWPGSRTPSCTRYASWPWRGALPITGDSTGRCGR